MESMRNISLQTLSYLKSCFNGATIDDMYFNHIPLLKIKPAALVLHVGTNNSSNETFQIYDKLLNLVHFVKENNLNCHIVLSSPINRLDDRKAFLTIKRLNSLLSESSLDIIDNSNIGHVFLVCMDCI